MPEIALQYPGEAQVNQGDLNKAQVNLGDLRQNGQKYNQAINKWNEGFREFLKYGEAQQRLDKAMLDTCELIKLAIDLTPESSIPDSNIQKLYDVIDEVSCIEKIELVDPLFLPAKEFQDKAKEFSESLKALREASIPLVHLLNGVEESIEKSLAELLPRLGKSESDELPEDEQWILYIPKQLHDLAKEDKNPGLFFDEKSPGYQKGMKDGFKQVAETQKGARSLDSYDKYNQLHKRVTEYISDSKKTYMRRDNGLNRGSEGAEPPAHFPVQEIPNSGLERFERFAALHEMSEEFINGQPLWQPRPLGLDPTRDKLKLPETIQKLPEKGIVMEHFESNHIVPLYSPSEVPTYVTAILKKYYDGREKPNRTPREKLREIARVVRWLYVLHPKKDGNTRTTIVALNIFLKEEGFCKVTLDPRGFKAVKRLDKLVKVIIDGMSSYLDAVETSKSK